MVTNFYVNQGQYTTKHILTHAFLIIYITDQLTSLSLTQSIVNHSCYVYTILTYKPAASPSAFRHKGVGHVSKLQGTPSVCLNQTVVRLPPRRRRHTLTSTHLHPRTYRPHPLSLLLPLSGTPLPFVSLSPSLYIRCATLVQFTRDDCVLFHFASQVKVLQH